MDSHEMARAIINCGEKLVEDRVYKRRNAAIAAVVHGLALGDIKLAMKDGLAFFTMKDAPPPRKDIPEPEDLEDLAKVMVGLGERFAKAHRLKRDAGIVAVVEAFESGDFKVAEKGGIQFLGPRSARLEDLPSKH